MSLTFSNFTVEEKANTREGISIKRGQTFKARYRRFIADKDKEDKRREETFFQLSKELFASTGLEDKENGGIQIVSPEGVPYIAVVKSNVARFLKQSEAAIEKNLTKKGDKFKSSILEDALHEQGVINKELVGKSQKLDLVKVADNVQIGEGDKAIQAIAVYQIVKDDSEGEVEEDEVAEGEATINAADNTSDASQAPQESSFLGSAADDDEF